MHEVAIVVLADTNTYEGVGRVVNAMKAVKEFKDAGDEVQLMFDGAGPKWILELAKTDHKCHGLYKAVQNRMTGPASIAQVPSGSKMPLCRMGSRLSVSSRAIRGFGTSSPKGIR